MSQMTIQQALELARAYHRAGQLREAESIFRQILSVSADPLVCNDLGNVLADARRFDEAISAYQQAIQLQPSYAEAFHNLATVHEALNRPADAIQAYREALRVNPRLADSHFNLGKLFQDADRFDEALGEYRSAIEIRPDLFEAHGNLGNALKATGKIDEAIAAFNESLRLAPHHPQAHRNLAGALLLSGDLPRGLEAYSRWRTLAGADAQYRDIPVWDGSDLNGRSILLYEQQGFGDLIQFIRFAPLVAARGGRVVVACPKELARLFQSARGIDALLIDGDATPAIDVRCSLFDLPRIFGTTIETIPASPKYLSADPALVQSWQQRLADVREFKVGLCWAGRSITPENRKRSIPFDQLSALKRMDGVRFFSLQKNRPGEQVVDLTDAPLIDWTSELNDFADTAALIENLDLVITIDTAIAHLAGAMGKRVWVLLSYAPDWRWLLGREDSPWYPTMKLFRQPSPGDWQTPISRILKDLRFV